MKRQFMTAMIAVVAIGSLIGLAPTAAQAQDPASTCFPPAGTADYPPTGAPGTSVVPTGDASGNLLPATDDSHVAVPAAPGLYCGMIYSAPITLNPTVSAGGVLSFTGIHVPSDFQVRVIHHMDVFKEQRLVGSYDFCVAASGNIEPVTSPSCPGTTSPTAVAGTNGTGTGAATGAGTKAAGALPHTGWDHLIQVLKAAALALGLGAFFMYLRRRRAAQVL